MQDLRDALRTLRKQPLFTLVAVLTLTLGIGANTAIFSVLYQVVLRPLPFREPARLVYVWNVYGKTTRERTDVSIPDYLDRRTQAPAIEDAALFTPRDATLTIGGAPEQVRALAVTPSFFSTLGRGPALGRAFIDADAVPGADASVILTDAFWRSHFAADPAIVGRRIRVNGEPREVAGVLPADFELPGADVSLVVPFAFTSMQRSDQERGNEFSRMIARLRPGATIAQLDAQMTAIVARLMQTVPGRAEYMRSTNFSGVAADMRETIVGDASTPLYLLQAGVLLVLLIACANVGNLVLMRATGRHRELAVRASLGASGARLLRQLLTEGLVLSLFGAAGGLLAGVGGTRVLMLMMADQLPRGLDTAPRAIVFVFTIALAAGTSIVFGLVPALPAIRGRVTSSLKDDATRASAARGTGMIRSALAVAELSLAVVLLVGAGLLIKSFIRLTKVDPGFSPDHVMTAEMTLPSARYPDAASTRAFWQRTLAGARAISGVTSAGLVSNLPFSGRPNSGSYMLVGRPVPPGMPPLHAGSDRVAGDYFGAMRIPLVEGRLFNDGDTADSPRVAIVDRFFARKQFPGESALGHEINFGGPHNYLIVGVVGTNNGGDLAKPVPEERIHLNAAQVTPASMTLTLRTSGDPASIASQIRGLVRAIDPEQAVTQVRTMDEWIGRSLRTRRAPAALAAVFGAVALALAAIGIYGVLAFGVAQRVREFGIRQALGARRSSILSLVLLQGLRAAAAGLVIGVGASVALTRYLQSQLFGVAPRDPAVFGAAALLLLAVALAACYIPARRATRVDPMVALREL
jgi:predicted permease